MDNPQPIIDALTKLTGDQTEIASAKADAVSKQQVAADAQHAADVANNAVVSLSGQFKADKQALHDLIDATFPTGEPTPAPTPTPAPAS